jgi:DNA-directed RNA polymerase specialized sigma24 family protein
MDVTPEGRLTGERGHGTDVLGRKAGVVVAAEDRQPVITDWVAPYEDINGRLVVDWDNAPANYEELFRQYRPEAEYWVRRAGVMHTEVDDTVQELLTRFMERDSLGVFRRNWESRSASGTSKFRSYFSQYIFGAARGKLRNVVRRNLKERADLDRPIGDDGSTVSDLVTQPTQADVELAELADVFASVREKVDTRLVDAVLQLALGDGQVRQAALREALGGVPPATAKRGLDQVRSALQAALAEAG